MLKKLIDMYDWLDATNYSPGKKLIKINKKYNDGFDSI